MPHDTSDREAKLIGSTLLGALLMFAGWLLAIVPTFQHIRNVVLVLVVAIVAYGLALLPSSLDILWPRGVGKKHGPVPVVVTMVPAAVLFLLVVAALPIGTLYRILAIVAEALGMIIYSLDWLIADQEPAG